MKNHEWRNGMLIQTNKKWSALKQSQRTWIQEVTAKEHAAYVEKHGKLPMKKQKETVLDKVHDHINERNIWIPYGEFHSHVSKTIDRLNHKNTLFKPPVTEAQPPRPKTPKAGIDEFPESVQAELKEKIVKIIKSYISQAHRIPPTKIRENHIKNLVRFFNTKLWHPYGKLLAKNDVLIDMYKELAQNIYDEARGTGNIPCDITNGKREKHRSATVILETERLILRKMNTKDWKDIRDMLADLDVMAAWERVFTLKRDIMKWIIRQLNRYDKDLVGYFAAVDKENGGIIGQIGLMWNDIKGKRCLEVGYMLKKEYWKNGYATEGARACIEYGFENFGVDKIYATIRPENAHSIAVAERIGMTVEGEFIKSYDGKKMKHVIYSIGNPINKN